MKPYPPEQVAFAAVLRAAGRLVQEVEALLKPCGISPAQYNVLRILRGAQPEGLSCSGIAARMINRDPDMTRLLDRMELRGWVVRERQRADRRVVVVQIGPEGLRLLAELDEPVLELHRDQFRALGNAGSRQLAGLLAAVGLRQEQDKETE